MFSYKQLQQSVKRLLDRQGHLHGDELYLAVYDKIMVKNYLQKLVRRGILKRPHKFLYTRQG